MWVWLVEELGNLKNPFELSDLRPRMSIESEVERHLWIWQNVFDPTTDEIFIGPKRLVRTFAKN